MKTLSQIRGRMMLISESLLKFTQHIMGFLTGQRNDYCPFLLQWDKQL
jgi:hypothetical protein